MVQSDVILAGEAVLRQRPATRLTARRRGKGEEGGQARLWDLSLERLAGRLTVSLNPGPGEACCLTTKLSGWPVLNLSLSLRASETGSPSPPPESLAELVKNVAAQALRCTQIDIK